MGGGGTPLGHDGGAGWSGGVVRWWRCGREGGEGGRGRRRTVGLGDGAAMWAAPHVGDLWRWDWQLCTGSTGRLVWWGVTAGWQGANQWGMGASTRPGLGRWWRRLRRQRRRCCCPAAVWGCLCVRMGTDAHASRSSVVGGRRPGSPHAPPAAGMGCAACQISCAHHGGSGGVRRGHARAGAGRSVLWVAAALSLAATAARCSTKRGGCGWQRLAFEVPPPPLHGHFGRFLALCPSRPRPVLCVNDCPHGVPALPSLCRPDAR